MSPSLGPLPRHLLSAFDERDVGLHHGGFYLLIKGPMSTSLNANLLTGRSGGKIITEHQR